MLKLYDAELSGNCHKARLMLSLLRLEHELVPVRLQEGEHNSPQLLDMNPLGQVLQVLDKHLGERKWLECDRPTIADVACYPYVGLAPDGKVSLEAYPNVIAWIERIKQLPGYISMPGL